MLKILPPILFVIAIVVMALLHYSLPGFQLLPSPYRWVGLLLLLAGLGTAAWHKSLFQRLGTNINTFKEPDQLVTRAMFRYSRNPMYLGFVVALVGVAALFGSLMPFVVAVIFFVVTDVCYIRYEEQAMEEKFGQEYRDYQRQVRRWL